MLSRPTAARRTVRRAAAIAAWAGVATGAATLATLAARTTPRPVVAALQAAGAAQVALALCCAAVGAASRDRRLTCASITVAGCWTAIGVVGVFGAHGNRSDAEPNLRIVSANLLWENERHSDVAAMLGQVEADIAITVETTDSARTVLTRNLAPQLRPVRTGSDGTGGMITIWSKGPTTPADDVAIPGWTLPAVNVTVGGRSVRVIGVHLQSPGKEAERQLWREQIDALSAEVAVMRHQGVNVVLAGDFNSALEHPAFRTLATDLTDAGRATGRLFARTWPAGKSATTSLRIPVLGIDHILVDDTVGVRAYAERVIPGSDHRAVIADLVI
jgi:endonuclease/exonuclease/phosphatase (EEP) superfamily protein YafD